MKLFVAIFMLMHMPSIVIAESKTYSYSLEVLLDKNISDVKVMILDREAYCESCRYKVENLRESTIVERSSDGTFFVFNDVYKMGAYPHFVMIKPKNISSNVIKINSNYVDSKKAEELTLATGYKHNPPFDRLDIEWTLIKISENKTKARYYIETESNNTVVKLLWKKIEKAVRAGAERMIANIKQ